MRFEARDNGAAPKALLAILLALLEIGCQSPLRRPNPTRPDASGFPDADLPPDGGLSGADGGDGGVAPGADALPDGGAPDLGPPNPLTGIGNPMRMQPGTAASFFEGPVWAPLEHALYFADVTAGADRQGIIRRLDPPTDFSEVRAPTGRSVGLDIDPLGLLLACEFSGRRISRTQTDGTVVTVVDRYNGMRLNSPNDLVVRSDGTIYFTDPPYGLLNPTDSELGFSGLFRVTPQGEPVLERQWPIATGRPNGVELSPNESILYLTDTDARTVTAFDVAADGSLSGDRPFVDNLIEADGMAVDRDGNVFIAFGGGISVHAPDGTSWGVIQVGELPANVAFGGDDRLTLYITARSSLYRTQMVIPGAR